MHPFKISIFILLGTSLIAMGAPSHSAKSSGDPRTLHASPHVIASQARTHSNQLYVSGRTSASLFQRQAHVDVQLLDRAGRVFLEKSQAIHSVSPRPGGGRRTTDTFVVTFPMSEARKAAAVRIAYHGGSHRECTSTGKI